MVQKLIVKIRFPWAIRVLTFTILGTSLIPAIILKSRLPAKKPGALIDFSPLKEPIFLVLIIGVFLGYMGLYIPVYIETVSESVGMRTGIVIYIAFILNAGSTIGRTVPSFFAHKAGSFNTLLPCSTICGILAMPWIAVKSEAGAIIVIKLLMLIRNNIDYEPK